MNRYKIIISLTILILSFVIASCDGNSISRLWDLDDENESVATTFTISFDANGGVGTMPSITVNAGTSCTIPANGFSEPSGTLRRFKGWNTPSDGTGVAYEVSDAVPATADTILYAQWTKPLFSISSTKKVYFSKGNLYWDGSKFNLEMNQFDTTPAVNDTYDSNHISHFYWSKTADVTYAALYSDVGMTASDVFFTNDQSDPEKSNLNFYIYDVSDVWRTFTGGSSGEWNYLFNTRTGALDKRGHATVCGVHGVVILPDDWVLPDGIIFNPGSASSWSTNIYDTVLWNAMENAGAVFLPATGVRDDTTDVYSVGHSGYYYSSDTLESNKGYNLYFDSSTLFPDSNMILHILSV